MRKLFSILLTPLFCLCFFLVLLIFQPIQWVCWNFFGYNAHKKSVDLLNGGLVLCYYLLGSKIHFVNDYPLPKNRTIIFLANHQSMLDIPSLIWYLRQYRPKFVSKRELIKVWPSIGYNLKKSGAALIDRSDSTQALQEIERFSQFIGKNNYSVILFPEGTRSKTGVMKPFALKGFLKILENNPQALVVPVAIENSWKIFKSGGFPLSAGEDLKWTVLEPIEPTGLAIPIVIRTAENAIRQKLGQERLGPSAS